jgi:hypothetical protein
MPSTSPASNARPGDGRGPRPPRGWGPTAPSGSRGAEGPGDRGVAGDAARDLGARIDLLRLVLEAVAAEFTGFAPNEFVSSTWRPRAGTRDVPARPARARRGSPVVAAVDVDALRVQHRASWPSQTTAGGEAREEVAAGAGAGDGRRGGHGGAGGPRRAVDPVRRRGTPWRYAAGPCACVPHPRSQPVRGRGEARRSPWASHLSRRALGLAGGSWHRAGSPSRPGVAKVSKGRSLHLSG